VHFDASSNEDKSFYSVFSDCWKDLRDRVDLSKRKHYAQW